MKMKSKLALIIAVYATLFAGVTAEAEDYADLVEKVMPSIVMIKTSTGTGSGFFVSSEGDVLTNYHVIQGAGYITVALQNGDSLQASLKNYDAKIDMALLAVNASYPVKFLKISPRLPRQGEAVIAISSPRGLSGTVTNGIVSAFRDNNSWVQFTAPVEQLKAARKKGANFNVSRKSYDYENDEELYTEEFEFGETPLHLAAMHNKNAGSIRFLISQGLDVNAIASSGNTIMETPLSCAVKSRNIDAVKELLKAGANSHTWSTGNNGSMFHIVASQYKDYSEAKTVISELVKAKGNVNFHIELAREEISDWCTDEQREYLRVQWMPSAPFGNIIDNLSHMARDAFLSSFTPLMYAVLYDNPDVVNILLDAKADPNVRSLEGKTAIDYAMLMPKSTKIKRSPAFKRLKFLTAPKSSGR